MRTRKKRKLAVIPACNSARGLDDEEEKPAAPVASSIANEPAAALVQVNQPAVELYQTLLSTATKLSQLGGGCFGDGQSEESVSFNCEQQAVDGGFKLRLQGTRLRWQDLSRKIASAQQQRLLEMDKRRQDIVALDAKSASLCLLMEKSPDEEQKQLSDELYCVRKMIGRHRAELEELQGRETLEVEASVEREEYVVEISVVHKSSRSKKKKQTSVRPACLYVVGGCGASGVDVFHRRLSATFCYDALEDKWTQRAELGRARAHPACSAVGNFVYVMGGIDSNGRLKDVDRLDISRQDARWEQLPALPQACVGSLALALGNKIYLVGGSCEAKYLARVLVFDTTSGVWSESVALSKERGYPGGCALNGKLYVFGGRSNSDEVLAQAESYQPGGSWCALAPLRVGRWGCSAGALGGKLYVIGGLNAQDKVLDSVERYDPKLDVWEEVAPLRQAREDSAAAVLNGELYVLGGSGSDGRALASVERYDEQLNRWSRVSDLPMYMTRAACSVAG